MLNKISIWLFTLLILCVIDSAIFASATHAHPGRTASDGCHYCRTNCSKWGETQDARHCHGGALQPKVILPPIQPSSPPSNNFAPIEPPSKSPTKNDTCPKNSEYSFFYERCICEKGYFQSLTGACTKNEPIQTPTRIDTEKFKDRETTKKATNDNSDDTGAVAAVMSVLTLTTALGAGIYKFIKKK